MLFLSDGKTLGLDPINHYAQRVVRLFFESLEEKLPEILTPLQAKKLTTVPSIRV